MAGLSTATKGAIGVKAAKGLAKNPGVLRVGARVAKPVVRRQVRRRGASALDGARTAITTLAVYAPQAAEQLGLVEIETPKRKRTAPRMLVGVVIGAAAVYFLEPGHGAEHRRQVMGLVS